MKWDTNSFEGDNAILELEVPIPEWSDFIMPACIHQKDKGLFSNCRSLIGCWSLRLNLIGSDFENSLKFLSMVQISNQESDYIGGPN